MIKSQQLPNVSTARSSSPVQQPDLSSTDLKLKEPAARTKEIGSLTGVRGLAAWWVVLLHLSAFGFAGGLPRVNRVVHEVLATGNLGVDLFFSLSGFVISYNYWRLFRKLNLRQYGSFLWMRLARMYPVHLATLLGALTMYTVSRAQGGHLRIGPDWTAAGFVQHVFLVQHWSTHPVLTWNTVSWSISCEWIAYLMFPLVVSWLGGRHYPRLFAVASLFALVSLCVAFQTWHWVWASAGMLRIAANFLAGVAVFQLWSSYGRAPRAAWLAPGALLAAVTLTGVSVQWPKISAYWMTLSFPVLLYGLACGKGLVARALCSKTAMFWGRVSYSLYMTHALTMLALVKVIPVNASQTGLGHAVVLVAAYIASIMVVAIATYLFIEEPARRWMRARGNRLTINHLGAAVGCDSRRSTAMADSRENREFVGAVTS